MSLSLSQLGAEEISAPSWTFDREGEVASAVRKIKCPSSTLTLLYAQAFPAFDPLGLPVPADEMPGLPWLYLANFQVDPFDDTVDGGTPPNCPNGYQVTLTYKSRKYHQDRGANPWDANKDTPGGLNPADQGPAGSNQTFISWKVSLGGSFLTLPGRTFQWWVDSAPLPPDVPAGITERSIEHHITMHYVSIPNWAGIQACLGRVNHAPFLNAPPECLLYNGLKGSREITVQGARQWELTHNFSFKNNGGDGTDPLAVGKDPTKYPSCGWNHHLRPDRFNPTKPRYTYFQRVQLSGGPPRPALGGPLDGIAEGLYECADFRAIFLTILA